MEENNLIIEAEEKIQSVFRNKNFVLMFLGLTVSRFGDVIFNFAMGWYILSLTDSAFKASIFIAIGMGTMLFFQLIGGVVADKFNKVRIVYLMDFVSGSSLIACYFLLKEVSDVTTILTILYSTSFVLNLSHALFVPASRSLMPKIVEENQYQQAQSLSNITMNINNIIGIFAAGFFYGIFHANGIILLNGISFILSGISEMFIHVKHIKEQIDKKLSIIETFFKDLIEGFVYIIREVGIIQLCIMAIFINFFMTPIFATISQYLFNQTLGRSAIEFSLTQGIFSIAAILMGLYLSVRRQPERVYRFIRNGLTFNYIVCVFLLGAVYLVVNDIITFIPFMVMYSLIMFLMGGIVTIVNVPLEVVLMKRIDKKMFGRVIAIFGTLVGLASPISIFLFGYLIDQIGILLTLMICVIGEVIGVIYLLFNKELKKI